MAKIRILPDNVANQIAAGEVVERPASVVKELVENSLDSGATRVEVEFRGGGKSYLRVEDNGCGMSADDALLCLERHATSKIREAKDLDSVLSFGFRGEAMPSIASVSRFTLRSRAEGSDSGTEVLVNGGKLIHQKAHGMAVGTQIEVANLFNSVPARRKFMKTDNTEAAHIIHWVRLFAVSRPGVAITLLENGRTIFKSGISKTLSERVAGIWSRKLVNDLVEIEAEEGGMRLWGLIGKPGVGRSTRQEMITFVNGRPIDSKTINYALVESYHTHIPKGRYPVAFFFLEINPALVDVNVHPAKREVRFRQEGLIRQFVIHSVLERLRRASGPEPVRDVNVVRGGIPEPVKVALPRRREVPLASGFKPRESAVVPEVVGAQSEAGVGSLCVQAEKAVAVVEQETRRISWRFIGHLQAYYALFEAECGLVVLNFRGAHQRICYESIRRSFENREGKSQPLLFPIPLELEPLASAALAEGLDIMNGSGFKIELFGRHFYRIEAIPEWLKPGEAEIFVRDVGELIQEHGSIPKDRNILYEKLARLAMQRVRIDERPSEATVTALADRLMGCENPQTCPRGYPTYYETSYSELEKRFGR